MSLYAFKTDNDLTVLDWVKATKKRGEEHNLLKNPFYWNIKSLTVPGDKSLFVVVDAKPVYFNFSWFGWITGVAVLFVWGMHWIVIPCMILGCLGIFWTAEFLFLMNKKALRKHGYTGFIKRLKHSETIRELIL